MTEVVSDYFALGGLLLTLIGAVITAWAVILKPEDAARIGVSRWSPSDLEEQLKLPMVRNLLAASRWAKRGLALIALGTFLQMAPVAQRLVYSIQ